MFTKSGMSWKMPEHQEPYTGRNMYLRSDIYMIHQMALVMPDLVPVLMACGPR